MAHARANVYLSQIASLGIHAVVDPPVFGEKPYNTARGVQAILQRYKELQDFSEGHYDSLPEQAFYMVGGVNFAPHRHRQRRRRSVRGGHDHHIHAGIGRRDRHRAQAQAELVSAAAQ